MRLFFLRHGQSTSNARWDASGIRLVYESDPELTELGRSQVATAARALSKLAKSPPPLYTSLLRRAAQSALIVSRELNTPPRARVELHEVGGLFSDDPRAGTRTIHSGQGRSALLQLYPGLILPEDLAEDGWWRDPFEEGPARAARANRAWKWLMAEHLNSDDDVVVIAHLGFFNEMMRVALGCALVGGAIPEFSLENGGVTLLECAQHIKVVFHNRMF
ncbi:MAG: histidine phosphatase family protein [Thermoflexales bacterium]